MVNNSRVSNNGPAYWRSTSSLVVAEFGMMRPHHMTCFNWTIVWSANCTTICSSRERYYVPWLSKPKYFSLSCFHIHVCSREIWFLFWRIKDYWDWSAKCLLSAWMRHKQRRSHLHDSSVTYVIVLTSMTLRIAPHKLRCLNFHRILLTMAVEKMIAPIVTPVRYLGIGQTTAMMMRPSNAPLHPRYCCISL